MMASVAMWTCGSVRSGGVVGHSTVDGLIGSCRGACRQGGAVVAGVLVVR